MDIVINACIQSPLFRNLSHVPADRLAFSHHITSNAPPLSKTKITVEPQTANNSLDADYSFRIPQFGFLNKVVLRLEYDIYPTTRFQVTPLLPLYHLIDEISLRTHHKPIQTLYGKEMLVKHAYFSEPSDKGAKFLGTLNPPPGPGLVDLGRMFANDQGVPFDPIADATKWNTTKRRVTMMVEVPLASTEAPHVNFDTRFVEHLDLYVKLRSTEGSDLPLGMAAGLMEQDLSQEFNPRIGRALAGDIRADSSRAGHVYNLRHEADQGIDTASATTGKASARTWNGTKTDINGLVSGIAAGQADDTDDFTVGSYVAGIVMETDGTVGELQPGDIVKIVISKAGILTDVVQNHYNGTDQLTLHKCTNTGYFSNSSWGVRPEGVADSILATFAEVVGSGTKRGASVKVYVPQAAVARDVVRNAADTANTFPEPTLEVFYAKLFEEYTVDASSGARTGTDGGSGASEIQRSLVNPSDALSMYFRSGILAFQNATNSVATSGAASRGPVMAPPCSDVGSNSFGSQSCPASKLNWVRIGSAKAEDSSFNGWGAAVDSSGVTQKAQFDKYNNGSVSAFADEATKLNYINANSYDSDTLNRRLIKRSLQTPIPNWAGQSTLGAASKQAILERYYTLYPHLLGTSTPGASIGDICVAASAAEGDALTGTSQSLDWPLLMGGRNGDGVDTTASLSGDAKAPKNISLTLSCTFLNYHDKIREDIATENFKDNAPATILQYDSAQEVSNAKYGQSGSAYTTSPGDEMVVHIKSNHLAYAISILAFRDKSDKQILGSNARTADDRSMCLSDGRVNDFGCVSSGDVDVSSVSDVGEENCSFPCYKVVENFKTIKPYYCAIKGSGRPIYECGVDSSAASLQSQFVNEDARGRIPGAGNCLSEGDIDNLTFNYNRTEGHGPLQGPESVASGFLDGVDRRIVGEFKDHASAHVISFGLNTSDQLANSGCLALQTINQPTLHLRFAEKCRVYVYVHHFSMIQIDSNTGNISKSLDV